MDRFSAISYAGIFLRRMPVGLTCHFYTNDYDVVDGRRIETDSRSVAAIRRSKSGLEYVGQKLLPWPVKTLDETTLEIEEEELHPARKFVFGLKVIGWQILLCGGYRCTGPVQYATKIQAKETHWLPLDTPVLVRLTNGGTISFSVTVGLKERSCICFLDVRRENADSLNKLDAEEPFLREGSVGLASKLSRNVQPLVRLPIEEGSISDDHRTSIDGQSTNLTPDEDIGGMQ